VAARSIREIHVGLPLVGVASTFEETAMSRNIETVQGIYAAFGRGDIPAILAALADDVEWEHDSVDHGIPWLTPRRGRASVGAFFASLAALEISRLDVASLLEGKNQVASVIHIEAKVKATGRVVRDLELHLFTFDDEGQVIRFRHVVDTLQHKRALDPA
jgi:uncharacterized protein